MNLDQWHIITCSSCGGVMKLPKNQLSGSASCPHCASPLLVPTAVVQTEAPTPPAKRNRSLLGPPAKMNVGITSLSGDSSLNKPVFGSPASGEAPDKLKSSLLSFLGKPQDVFTPKGLPDWEDADESPTKPAASSHLPAPRAESEAAFSSSVVGESWQPEPRALKEVDFKDKLTATTDVTKQRDPSLKRKKKRRLSKAEAKAKLEAEGWDNGVIRREQSLGTKLRNTPWGLVGLALVFVVTAFYFGLRPHFKNFVKLGGGSQEPETEILQVPTAPSPESLETKAMLSFLPDANLMLERFFEARTINNMLKYVRDPNRLEGVMVGYYRKNGEIKALEYNRLLTPDTVQIHKQFISGTIEMKDYSYRNIILERTREGFKVDWESFVAYCDMSWPELLEKRPKTPQVFRVLLRPDPYWNYDFTDSSQWRSFRLTDNQNTHGVWGYVAIKSTAYDRISQALLGDKDGTINCVVSLAYPENSTNATQLEIKEFLETGWAFRPDDFNFQLSELDIQKAAKPLDLDGGTPAEKAAETNKKQAEAPKTEVKKPIEAVDKSVLPDFIEKEISGENPPK